MWFTGARVVNVRLWQSLTWRLTVLISGCCLATLVVVLYAAHREVAATLLEAGTTRAHGAASHVAEIFGRSSLQSLELAGRIAPELRTYLREPTATHLAAAQTALAPLAPGPNRVITVWDAAGQLVLTLPGDAAAVAKTVPIPARAPAPGIHPMQASGDRAITDMAVAVESETREPLGTLAVRAALSITPPDALNRLVGNDARVLFGNRTGDLWTDGTRRVDGPLVNLESDGGRSYQAANGQHRVGALHGLPGTPWVVWVEFPAAALVAPARQFLQRMAAVGLAIAIAMILLARWFSSRLTTPVVAMTTAVEAMAGGDYSRRVEAGSDEIGRLAQAFNTMSAEVAGAQQQLADKVAARTQELNAALAELDHRSRGRDSYLATIVESSADAIIGKSLDGRVTSWNRAAEQIFGYAASEVIGQPILWVIPPDRHREEADILDTIRGGGTVEQFETVRLTKDGLVLNVSLTISPIKDAADHLIGVSTIARDITASKESATRLRTTEGRYRALFDYAPDGILIADNRGTYLDVNASMCRMLGYQRHEVIGMASADIVAPAEVEHIETALSAIESRHEYQREWQFRRRDGSVFPAEVIATEMPDGNILAMARDVTDRNRSLDAVRTAEERMRFALEGAEIGIWDADYRAGTVTWSPILEHQYGLAPGSFGGTSEAFMACVHPEDRASMSATIAAAVKSGDDFSMQYRVVRPDGSIRWVNGAGRVQRGPHGEPLRAIGISIDVTGRRQLEAQFQQAQKMEAIGRLAGGVAHDFNNLLTVILGNCELLGTSATEVRALRSIVGIETAANQAAGLTRQLLAFSRKQIIEPTLVDLNAVVADLKKMLARLIGEDINVVVNLPAQLGRVTADANQVEQVVMNLAVNARDAMPTGGTLTIQTANIELDDHYAATHFGAKAGPHVVLTISDTGVGMAPEVQARLFEPFFTTKEVGKGTGLGLATVHGIVARSGGSIGVYSEVGRGTSFKVYFPRTDSPEVTETRAVATPALRGAGETILVVEDSDLLRLVTKELLERQGYTVLLAASATEALEVFQRHPQIDVMLTDVVMPGASGPELTARVKAERPHLKVIFMSGYTEEAIGHHGVSPGGAGFLHKPFTSETLGRSVRDALAS